MTKLNGKIAIVTGGNSGIGYAAAKELKANGARVVITGRRREAVEKAAAELGVDNLIADQSNMADIHALTTEVARRFGKVDILLINAGISLFSTIQQATEKLFDDVLNVNVRGAYFTLSRFIPILNDGSSVVLLSSTSAHTSSANTSVYSLSKAAVNAFMKVAAIELAPRKIRVNSVSPGPVATEIMEKSGLGDRKIQDFILAGIPVGRFGQADEVGKLIAYLSGDDATFITGAEFIIDGGQVLNT